MAAVLGCFEACSCGEITPAYANDEVGVGDDDDDDDNDAAADAVDDSACEEFVIEQFSVSILFARIAQ